MRLSNIVCFGAIMGLLTTPAYAYLDPGTGSMILQAIVGAIAVGAASASMYWHRLKSFFRPSARSEDQSQADDDQQS